MNKSPAGNDASKQAFRKQAEARLARSADIPESLSPDEISDALHELRVHQIELEMQNEELRSAQAEIEAGRARFFDLYDLAPVGYCTLSEQGLILEANLMVATLLGTARGALVKQPISHFIVKEDQDTYYLHRKKLFATGEPQECELRLVKPGGTVFWSQLTATAARAEDGTPLCRVVLTDITARKRTEKDLFDMAERYRLASKASNDVVWDWDIVNDAQRWNESGAAVFGWTDIVNAPQTAAWWVERVHPEDRARVDGTFFAAVRDPAVDRWHDEYRFRKADGAYAHVVDRGHILRDAAGRAVRVIGAMLDITERKQSEDALRRSRQLLAATEALSAVGGWEWDVAAQAMAWTDGTYRIHDLDAVAMPAGSPEHIERSLACYDPVDRSRVEEAFRQCVETGEPYDLECDFTTANGRRLCVRTMGRAIRKNGRTVKVLGNLQDITERRRTGEALKASEMRFKELLLHVPTVAVQGYAMDGTVRYWNRASETFYGYTAEEALGHNLMDLIIPPAMRDGVWAAIRRMAETGEMIPASEVELMRKDGSLIAVYSSHALVKLPGKEPELFCIDIDLTELKQTEAEQEKLHAQFLQAQKMESVGRLAGGVAHDFNNLLMGIMGYTDLCRDQVPRDHPIREWLDEITTEAQRSANLVRQLLAFARKQVVKPTALDMNEQIGGMLKLLGRLIGERVALTWSPAATLHLVNSDPSHIDQIMANLCVNAADAITGSGRIAIATRNVAMDETACAGLPGMVPGAYVLLSVADTGCGMDADTVSHLFEPFFTTKGVGRGTGLGLATVYGIVKQSGGFIYVDSDPGAGTTFSIYLPAIECPRMKTVPPVDADPPPGGSETILVVDDEKSIRITTATHLERLGYTVLMADGPETALRLSRKHAGAIDLLLSDMVMPGMGGVELRDSLRPERPGMKTIFITGYTTADFVESECKETDTVHLTKPVPIRELAIAIRSVLNDQHSGKS